MRFLEKPQWLLLVNTLPAGVLLLLGGGTYGVVSSLLPAASVAAWQAAALGLLALTGATLLAAWLSYRAGEALSTRYAVFTLLAYSTFLGWALAHETTLLPREVPRWLVPTDVVLYAWTFLMPTLLHALLVLVRRTTPTHNPSGALLCFLLALAAPFAAGIPLAVVGSALGADRAGVVGELVMLTLLGAGVTLILYLLLRGVYVLLLRRHTDGELSVFWKLMLSLVLPPAGLFLNNSLGSDWGSGGGMFGDFNGPWFYALAVANGLLLSWPTDDPAPGWRLALLAGRSVLLSFTLYFALVFLPFVPLGVLAIVFIGLGMLMLTPVLLLVLHVQELSDDVAALLPRYGRRRVLGVLLAGVLTLPALVTLGYAHQRRTLHAALDYAYSPDYAARTRVDASALAATLATVHQHREIRPNFVSGNQQPYLSAYFNWLVLDNLLLSMAKEQELAQLFLNEPPAAHRPGAQVQPVGLGTTGSGREAPALRELRATSRYDAARQTWVSEVSLEVMNRNPNVQRGEYATRFALPPGCWVSDYYLEMNGRREPGVLAEKRAADWLFRQVVSADVPRDPGLLTYDDPGHLRLLVYPVQGDAPRRTGFTLLHREPATLRLDGQEVQLGDPAAASAPAAAVVAPGGAVAYVSAAARQALPLVRRQPYYHFLLDVSAGQYGRKVDYQRWIQALVAAHPLPGLPRYTLVNTYATAVPAGADWQRQLDEFANEGGCNFTGAIGRTLADAWQHPAGTYPVLVAVTDSLPRTVLAADFAAFAPACPESPALLVLDASGPAEVHSLLADTRRPRPTPLDSVLAAPAVRAWPTAARPRAYLPDSPQPAVLLTEPAATAVLPLPPTASPWLTGLQLAGASQWQTLHPALANARFGSLVQASFRAGLLSPWTAFLALENDAQRAALRRKQAQTITANANLDVQEAEANAPSAVPLDDYAPWLLALGLTFGLWRLRRRR